MVGFFLFTKDIKKKQRKNEKSCKSLIKNRKIKFTEISRDILFARMLYKFLSNFLIKQGKRFNCESTS